MGWRFEVAGPVLDGVREHVAEQAGDPARGGLQEPDRAVLDRRDQVLQVLDLAGVTVEGVRGRVVRVGG